jgi:hypothetical protein
VNRTVDLISYTITALKPVPEFEEAVPGSGGLCGSSFLNRIFAKYMRDKFGSHSEWSEDALAPVMEYFESEKRKFQGDPNDEFTIPVSAIEDSPPFIVKGILRLSSEEVSKSIFDPVINEIVKLVKDQIRATEEVQKTVKAILLVGGFGENIYLHNRLRAEVGRDIKVMGGLHRYVLN